MTVSPDLSAFGIDDRTVTRFEGRSEVWRAERGDHQVVLRRNDPRLHPPTDSTLTDDVGWVHRFLVQLGGSTFATPKPVPLFDGDSVAIVDGAVWEALTFIPGRVVGWNVVPTMFDLGACLAEFHDAASAVVTPTQRDPCVSVASLIEPATWATVSLPMPVRRVVTESVGALAEELDRIDYSAAGRSPVHGDFTNHNVLASGQPPLPCGVIDFANAYCEAPLADVGFALWRSGRPAQDIDGYDPARLESYVAGYHSRRPLGPDGGRAVVAYLRARGLQIIVKQARREGAVDTGPVRKLGWLLRNTPLLRRRLSAIGRS